MLEFKNIEIEDASVFERLLKTDGELSCENTFTNLIIWQSAYDNMMAVYEDMLFIKSCKGDEEIFALPFGENLSKGIELIKEYCGKMPTFWVSEGAQFDAFLKLYGGQYKVLEMRENFDYIYNTEDLSELSGKKYHGKRNHISAFSKKYDWKYITIDSSNIEKIKTCSDEWYAENGFREDFEMHHEKRGIEIILDNIDTLGIKGGAIEVGGRVVAFTLGTPINKKIFNVHIEKALGEFSEAYTLINREFVKNELSGYELVNREDDLGLEGLRKAKLSYKPCILLKKFICTPKEKL